MRRILLAAVAALALAPTAAAAGTWATERNAKGVNFATTWDDNHSFFVGCYGDVGVAFSAKSDFGRKVLAYADAYGNREIPMTLEIDGEPCNATVAVVAEDPDFFMLQTGFGNATLTAELHKALIGGRGAILKLGRFQVSIDLHGSRAAISKLIAVCVANGTYGSQYAPASESTELEM